MWMKSYELSKPDMGSFRNRTLLVTGATGRVGNRLLRRLASLPFRRLIVGLRQFRPEAELARLFEWPDEVLPRVDYRVIDLTNSASGSGEAAPADMVFHLAGVAAAKDESLRPVDYFDVNCLGTARLLAAWAGAGTQVVFASTTHVYGEVGDEAVSEEYPTNPLSSYAASKLAAEIVVRDHLRETGASGAILRFSNLYGPDSGENTVVGRALAQCVRGEPVRLRSLAPIRDFVHVDDSVEAILRVAAVLDQAGENQCHTLNVASGRGVSVGAMVRILADCARKAGLSCQAGGLGDGELCRERQLYDVRKLHALTDWVPCTGLDEGLGSAIREFLAEY